MILTIMLFDVGEHPLMLKDLEGERHKVSITPVCEGTAISYSRIFFLS